MTEAKTKQNDTSVMEFLNTVEDRQRRTDCLALLDLFTEVTNEPPKMWGTSIVGYGTYHYKYDSGREGDSPLAGFSPRKQNLTIYVAPEIFKECEDIMRDLGKYKTSLSCLYVKKLSDIDTDKLKELVRKSVDFMKKKYK